MYPGQGVEVHRAYAIANKALEIEKVTVFVGIKLIYWQRLIQK